MANLLRHYERMSMESWIMEYCGTSAMHTSQSTESASASFGLCSQDSNTFSY